MNGKVVVFSDKDDLNIKCVSIDKVCKFIIW